MAGLRLVDRHRQKMVFASRRYPKHFQGYRTPTLISGGRYDNFLTPTHHLHIAGLIPGSETHTFENSGHSAYWEEPAEFNRVVSAFLERNRWV